MHWSHQVYVAAGLGALALGGGVLLREPGRRRARLFALLCAALALWTLGVVARKVSGAPELPWHALFLLGSCAAAPLGLHFSLALWERSGTPIRGVLLPAYVSAAVLWVAAAASPDPPGTLWKRAAILVLGGILAVALAALFRAFRSLPAGPERRAHRLLFGGGVVAVVGGLSDFVPRDLRPVPELGPAAAVVFLIVVCSVIVRHRFLDVDAFLIRALIFGLGAAAGALVIFGVVRASGVRYFPIFLATLLLLLAAGSLGRTVMSGARTWLSPQDPVAAALLEVSRTLPGAVDDRGVWQAIGHGREALPADVHVDVVLYDDPHGDYRLRFRAGRGPLAEPVAADAPLPRVLQSGRLPVTAPFLAREALERHGDARRVAGGALSQLEEAEARLVVPLWSGDPLPAPERGDPRPARPRLIGWIAVGGGFPDRYLTAEVAAAFLAVGQQAVASLERLEAVEIAKRREALAAVGEMAAGLAHEVRNPVAAIHGAAQAISPDSSPAQAAEMLAVIAEETSRLGRVVGEFLDYARPASPRREPVHLEAVARHALRSAELAGCGLRSKVSVAGGVPPVAGDPEQLVRVFENLIRNAREAAGAEGRLRIEVGRGEGDRVSVRVEDDGPGIPDDQLPHLFRPFRSGRPGGTGLGLALVQRIIEDHGGTIRADGRPGEGARFTLTLPVARA